MGCTCAHLNPQSEMKNEIEEPTQNNFIEDNGGINSEQTKLKGANGLIDMNNENNDNENNENENNENNENENNENENNENYDNIMNINKGDNELYNSFQFIKTDKITKDDLELLL